jgi:diguanylate cyclase (GGDEF)-like protein/PAS domain S-box-containing protein
MSTVLASLFGAHDLGLVALAAIICMLASFAGIGLWQHAARSTGRARYGWLAAAAVVFGFGVWATHFVAILGYRPDFPLGYDALLTVTSALIAIALMGGGMWIAAIGENHADHALGGAIAGLGIATMHYVGMASILLGGAITWDAGLVAASVILGVGLGGLAAMVAGWGQESRYRLGGAGLFTLAICAMHFTGMGAASLENCFPIVSPNDGSSALLTLAVAGASLIIIGAALVALLVDRHERARDAAEESRMRALVDAAVEGLVVVDDGRIVTSNAAFQRLVQHTDGDLIGMSLTAFLPGQMVADLAAHPNVPHESDLATSSGQRLPVEIILRPVDFAGQPRHALAVRDLSARKKDEQHIRFLAHHDALTGLANRASFGRDLQQETARARRLDQRLAVLCLDLDRFKEVNDLFGHGAGDTMLQDVARCLTDVVGEGRTAGRLGGDEFAVIMPDIAGPDEAGRLADELLEAFRRHNVEAPAGAYVSASIGIALYPSDATSPEELMVNADTALYRAKQDGRGVYRFFETEMGATVRERRLLEADLRGSLARGELSLVYQPLIEVATGKVTGFETLLRWTHPRRGAVSPAIFIPLAEENGQILSIGQWVLQSACAEAVTWKNPLTIAVNVSAVQLHSNDFVSQVRRCLAETGLSPARLEIEITETALVRDMARAVATLAQIKALGVKVAMDDFGTGYSSLSNLRAFPFDKIKVDQSFIRSVDRSEQSAAIVRAVLGLGNGLKLPVVAEGVERPEELEFLRNEICNEAQGFLMSRPLDIGAFAAITSGRRLILEPTEAVTTIDNVTPIRASLTA